MYIIHIYIYIIYIYISTINHSIHHRIHLEFAFPQRFPQRFGIGLHRAGETQEGCPDTCLRGGQGGAQTIKNGTSSTWQGCHSELLVYV